MRAGCITLPGHPMLRTGAKLVAVAFGLLLAGCGGGGGGGGGSSETPLAAGEYHLVFTLGAPAAAGASAATPVNGVDLAVVLPEGVTVAVLADGSHRIPAWALSVGSGVHGTSQLVGRYLADQRQAHLTLAVAPTAAWFGDFAVLTITVPADASVLQSALLQSSAAGLAGCTVLGLDASSHDTATLAGSLVSASLVKP